MADYGDQVTLARVYEKVSKKSGNTYFVGRIGLAKIAILRSKETAENGDAIWNIVLSEGQNIDKRWTPAEQVPDTQAPLGATDRATDGSSRAVEGVVEQAADRSNYRRNGSLSS